MCHNLYIQSCIIIKECLGIAKRYFLYAQPSYMYNICYIQKYPRYANIGGIQKGTRRNLECANR